MSFWGHPPPSRDDNLALSMALPSFHFPLGYSFLTACQASSRLFSLRSKNRGRRLCQIWLGSRRGQGGCHASNLCYPHAKTVRNQLFYCPGRRQSSSLGGKRPRESRRAWSLSAFRAQPWRSTWSSASSYSLRRGPDSTGCFQAWSGSLGSQHGCLSGSGK